MLPKFNYKKLILGVLIFLGELYLMQVPDKLFCVCLCGTPMPHSLMICVCVCVCVCVCFVGEMTYMLKYTLFSHALVESMY
jgi:hypothetical protein